MMKSLSRNLMLSVIALGTFTFQGAKADMIDLYMMGILPSIVAPNKPPVADAGPDQSISICDTLELNASESSDPDGSIVKYVWTSDDGQTVLGEGEILNILPESTRRPGDYNITLSVTDDDNATDATSINVTINGEDDDYDFSYIIADPYAADAEDYIEYKSTVKLRTEDGWKYWYPTSNPGVIDMHFTFSGNIQIANLKGRIDAFKFSSTHYGEAYLYAKNDDNAPEWTELDSVSVSGDSGWVGGGSVGFVQDDLLGTTDFWVRTILNSHGYNNLAQFLRYKTDTDAITFKPNVCHDGVDPQ